MARPTVSAPAEELYEALDPAFASLDSDLNGWPALKLCDVLCASPIVQIHTYATDQDDGTPGWLNLLDPDLAPVEVLPWLAQFGGVILTPEMDEATVRAAIKLPRRFQRGTREALEFATEQTLTGDQRVLIEERYQAGTATLVFSWRDLMAHDPTWGDVGVAWATWGSMPGVLPNTYRLRVRTLFEETPDPAATEAAIYTQKPIGLVLIYETLTGQDWADLAADHATWTAVQSGYATWLDVISDLP